MLPKKSKMGKIGEEAFLGEETNSQIEYCNFRLYCQLKDINYTNIEIAEQLHCSLDELERLEALFN